MSFGKTNKGLWGLLVMAVVLACAFFWQRQTQHQRLQEGWHHGAFMEIFVRSYKDSNGDGIGDLKGLTQSLDHLKELGIKGIWLMPITVSADHDHGYATRDYRNIEPDYGTLTDFDELIQEAHKRGIGVIMDYVLNHSAFQHPYFEEALVNPQSRYRQWYEWRHEKPEGWNIWGRDPWVNTVTGSFLATFGAPMPDFNMRNPEVVKYHEDNLKFWLDRGIDGFRLDAAPHLIENSAKDWNDQPESRQLTNHFVRMIKSYPNKYVVCEATAEPKAYAREDICGGAFAFGLENQIAKAAKGEREAIQKVALYYTQAPHTLASFASNHDQFAGKRLWEQVIGNEVHYKLAAATYLLLPGTPFIYYGEEIGMAGAQGLTDDPFIRGPYSWQPNEKTAGFSAAQPYRAVSGNVSTHHAQGQKASDHSIWSFYRDMLKLRHTRTSLAKGSFEAVQTQGQVLAYQRKAGQEHSAVVINYGTQPAALQLEGIASNAILRPIYPSKGTANQKGAQLTMPAQSVYVFAVEK